MDKIITTTFLLIISVVVSVMVFNTVYPAVASSSESLVSARSRMDDRLRSQVEIVHVAGELNTAGIWQDGNGNGLFDVIVWVKNVGSMRIPSFESMDVFVGPEGNYARIPYTAQANGVPPYWDAVVENGERWDPTATLRISVHYASVPERERYFVKVVLPVGVSDEIYFGL